MLFVSIFGRTLKSWYQAYSCAGVARWMDLSRGKAGKKAGRELIQGQAVSGGGGARIDRVACLPSRYAPLPPRLATLATPAGVVALPMPCRESHSQATPESAMAC